MTRLAESPGSGKPLASPFSLVVTLVFLVTAVLLWWDPWSGAQALAPPYSPVAEDLTKTAAVRTETDAALYYGSENCKKCHSKREYKKLWNDWSRGHPEGRDHRDVDCEACHGPAGDHALEDIEPRPPMPVTLQMLSQPYALCMGCHGKVPGRETTVKQIECDQHLADWKINPGDAEYEEARQCLSCHDPHRPVKD